MSKICSFFGHSDFWSDSERERIIKAQIVDCIQNRGITHFLIGGYGEFDIFCAKYLRELRAIYPQIRTTLVLAYLGRKMDDFEKEYIRRTFDSTIFPPIENVPPRFAIVKRNEWIVRESDFVIFFVERAWGGAYQMLRYARGRKKAFVNLGCGVV